ncbi:ATP-dependent DNA ligase [Candidatus Woesearchaeota archaeon]|nr:MAG: hypothetical protein QS99_C0017G0019 [archaeon GW2011_AR4]MBS3130336.1 ATP-dependent DNA ligase [Candidatus Woesearchaeota archaeon]HIH38943.1 ATP-dependent DNA ligase [Candidatus Woesearchaeota archaeon]HIH48060.1 ATP-dependent DNA ligase [Candidatus Woesearchaeota archaeon]HIJ03404.1 ATP-dependent DNA ligase [Candidatus Woesearchaeota archaeon]
MRYKDLVDVYEQLDATSKRLEKTYLLAELLKKTSAEDLEYIIRLIEGKVFPSADERTLGMASRLVVKAINTASGIPPAKIEDEWQKTGDLGIVAEKVMGKKTQSTLFSKQLTIDKVVQNLRKLPEMEGQGSVERKTALVAELLTSATPKEARYLVRMVLEVLRVGIGEGTIRDAIAWAYFPTVVGIFFSCDSCGSWNPKNTACLSCGKELSCSFSRAIESFKGKKVLKIMIADDLEKEQGFSGVDFVITPDEGTARDAYNYFIGLIQQAYELTNDYGIVAAAVKKNNKKGLELLTLQTGNPVKVMLAQKEATISDGFSRVGKPAAVEYKLDGFRLQIHNDGKKIILYTRRLEDVSAQFPDVVDAVKKHVSGKSFILDTECAGYDAKTKKYLPFQHISQRIKRKYDIHETAKQFPVEVNVFDVLMHNEKSYLGKSFSERREVIEKIVTKKERVILPVTHLNTSDEKEAEKFYKASLAAGNEGIMMKNLDAPYQPGSRVGTMIKIKPVMDTLDLVVVEAEWGEGKRATWLTSFTLACREENGDYLTVGKVGTGVKEKEEEGLSFPELTELLRKNIVKQEGKHVIVKPKIVLEVKFEEIQKSPTYTSGYALRFPRVVGLREDRTAEDASTQEMVEKAFKGQ